MQKETTILILNPYEVSDEETNTYTRRDASRAVVYLLLIKDGKVLLLRRANTGYADGMYSLPAGHIDGNEAITRAMSRETKEEVDLDIPPEDLRVVHVIHKLIDSEEEHDERLHFILAPTKWEGEIQNMEPEKCDDLSWFPLDVLPDNTLEHIRVAIENAQKGIFYSELGWK